MKIKLNRRVLLGLGIIVVLAAIVAIALAVTSPKAPPANVAVVRRGDLSASVNATGKATPKKTARLSLPVSGIVANIAKQVGDTVKPGDVILSLRAGDAERQVQQAELNLQARQLDLARAKAAPPDTNIEIARANLNKATIAAAAAQALYSADPNAQNDAARQAAQQDLDIARANFDQVTSGPTSGELDALQNAITSAQISLASAKQTLAQTQLTAPYTSTITEIDAHAGELIGGFNQLAAVADLSALEIDADIDEIDVANVQVGQPVQVRFDAFPGETFTGKLTRLFPAASTQRGTTTYSAIVDFDARNFNVRPGMGANLKILTIQKTGVLLVPNRALKSVGTRKAVHVLAPGAPRDVIVETGVTDGNETEIVSGLNEGDQVQLQ